MSTGKDFASKDLTPEKKLLPLAQEADENFFEMAGVVRVTFNYSIASPMRKLWRWLTTIECWIRKLKS